MAGLEQACRGGHSHRALGVASALAVALLLFFVALAAASPPTAGAPIGIRLGAAVTGDASDSDGWRSLGWIAHEAHPRSSPSTRAAALPMPDLPEPMRQVLVLLALTGLVWSLRRL